MNKNILILSAGTRNKIVQYFKKSLKGKGNVYATDCSVVAPALYEADKHFIVPRIDDDNYLSTILEICLSNQVDVVLSLIDPELSLISSNLNKFVDIGVMPIVSNSESIKLSFDKFSMFQTLRSLDLPTVVTYSSLYDFNIDFKADKIKFPVFVKPRKGSASVNINKVDSLEDLEVIFKNTPDLIIQEFMDGVEIGVDVYIDMITGKLITLFAKKKLIMRAGETDKSVSIKSKQITNLIESLVDEIDFRGVIDVDLFEVNGEYFISEVNPRFGGGYPHAYECGIDIPSMIINNALGNVNNPEYLDEHCYSEGITMMKYNEIMIRKV